MSESTILCETHGDGERKTALIRLNRPKALNALNEQLMNELGEALLGYDRDDAIASIVLTGSDKAFAAGADIPSIAEVQYMDAYKGGLISRNWETIRRVRKPVIGAVAGFALGGGCELAMMCDTLIAADNAKFGQPELKIGVIPGAGGTQRLPREIGKAKAMDLVLTGRMMDATEAERAGLVSRVVPLERLIPEALDMGALIATLSAPSVLMAKESINRAFESGLSDGLAYERLMFQSLFGTEDQREGMAAFLAKRKPEFKHR